MTKLNAELVNKVKHHFNLNIYETKVWLALLTKGMASAGEIAELSEVPRSRTYDVLESLEKQGFAMQKIGKPVKYIAIKPQNIIEKLKKNVTEHMNSKIETLSNIKDTAEYKELELLHSSNDEIIKKQDISGTIKGKLNINSQISDILSLAKKEVIICTSVDEFKKRVKTLDSTLKQINKAGVKTIIALNGDEKEIKGLSEKHGLKINKVDLDSSFYIADKAEILFMLNKADNSFEEMAVWFSSPFFVQSFTGLFDMALKKGK